MSGLLGSFDNKGSYALYLLENGQISAEQCLLIT